MAPSKTKKSTINKAPAKKVVSRKNASVKKAVQKVMTKKASKKAPKKPATRKKTLPVVEGDMRFWVIYDGPVLASLRDLSVAVIKLSKDQFEYHAYGVQNDFAVWVRYALRDTACAKDIEKASSRRGVKTCVDSALRRYK